MKFLFSLLFLTISHFSPAQNIGIGESNPTEKLQLGSGNIKLGNSDKGIILNGAARPIITRALDTFTAGSYPGLGRWGLFQYNNNISIGMPNLADRSFAVTKLDPNGRATPVLEVKTNGAIEVNGNAGTTGQVLTSNEDGVAEWRSGSLPKVRFATSFTLLGGTEPYGSFGTSPRYLMGDIKIFQDSIVFPTAGLYHFDIFHSISIPVSTAPATLPFVTVEFQTGAGTAYPTVYPIIRGYMQGNSNGSAPATVFNLERQVSIDIHIAAGNFIKLHSINSINNRMGFGTANSIRGYLISE